ncbi:DDE family transposase, partial [Nonlabens dokdonensis]
EYKQYIEANFKRVQQQPEIYKKRQAIVEHLYGTIKRQWGFDHIITKKGIQNASADFGLIAIAYNLKRILNIIKEQGKLAFILNKQRHKAIFKLLSTFLSLFKPKIIIPTHFLKIYSHHFSNVNLN